MFSISRKKWENGYKRMWKWYSPWPPSLFLPSVIHPMCTHCCLLEGTSLLNLAKSKILLSLQCQKPLSKQRHFSFNFLFWKLSEKPKNSKQWTILYLDSLIITWLQHILKINFTVNCTFFFFLATPWHLELPGQESELSHNHSCGNRRSLTHCARARNWSLIPVLPRGCWSPCASVGIPKLHLL